MPRRQRRRPHRHSDLPRRSPGTGSLQRLPDGRLRARLPKAVDPKRTAREFPADALDEAVAWLDARVRGVEYTTDRRTSLGTWAGRWWQSYVDGIRAPGTAVIYLRALRRLEPFYAQAVADVRTIHLQGIVSDLAGKHAPASVQNTVGVWRQMFESAIDNGLILRNPCRGLSIPKGERRTPARSLTAREIGLLSAAVAGHRFEAAYLLILGCGLRIGEVLGLHWSSVDVAGRRVWIQHQFTNGRWRATPKGYNPHWVPLPDHVLAALIRHRDRQETGCVLVFQSPFVHRSGKPWPWAYETVARDFRRIVREAGVDPLTPHAGRHGLATHWLTNGVSPAVVAQRLGHSNPSITYQHYLSETREGTELADRLVEDLLGDTQRAALGDRLGDSEKRDTE